MRALSTTRTSERERSHSDASRTTVSVVGDACVDVYENEPGAPVNVGGNALNVAMNLARHGVRSRLFCVVGDDEHGAGVRRALACNGVETDFVSVVAGPTWAAYLAVESGVTRVVREDEGVAGLYAVTSAVVDSISQSALVHLANVATPGAVLAELRARDVVTSYDHGVVADWANLPAADFGFFSHPDGDVDEATELAIAAVEQGTRLAIVTRGGSGSLAYDGTRVINTPAEAIEPVDTIGAGDSYIAAFLAAHLESSSLKFAMLSGCRAATQTCLHPAAWPQTPLNVEVIV